MNKRYKVKMGRHIEDGKLYTKGQVVTSDRNLCQLFPQKFTDLTPSIEENEEDEQPEPTPTPAKPKAVKKKAAKKAPTPAVSEPPTKTEKGEDDWED